MSRGVVLRRRLPEAVGGHRIFVSPDSSLRYWRRDLGAVDAPLLRALGEWLEPGQRMWDVGANVGLAAFASAGLVGATGAVLALEPDLWLAGLLRRSARLRESRHAAVEVLPAALSDRVGTARFQVALRGRASNSIAGFGRDMAGGVRETQLVPTTTLDALARELAPPDLVKIDVEGAEDLVLRGGRDLLENARPVVVCEVGPERRDSVTELFRGHRYALYDMDHEKATRRRLERAVWNTIAVPE